MRCPKCQCPDSRVIDSRCVKDDSCIRRRRECPECEYRFTTTEITLRDDLQVIKRDARREAFDRDKLLSGLLRATEKRPIDREQIEGIVTNILEHLDSEYDTEVPSQVIGELTMARLKALDQIAYVRFASVYKDFRDIREMADEILELNTAKSPETPTESSVT